MRFKNRLQFQFKNRLFLSVIFLVCFQFLGSCQETTKNHVITKNETPPNIIYILADDLGYGDLSVYGQKKFKTPNIDKLASEGMLFTQHYSGSTVCAPSRSTLMTGQHTGHTPIRGNKEISPEGQHPIADEVVTVAEVLQKQGYTTGIFGKWGLGYPGSEGAPNNQGFDTFYGFNCQRLGHSYYPHHLWDNEEKVVFEGNAGNKENVYAPIRIHEETLKFIEDNKDTPFFAYVASIIPHAELKVPEKYLAKFRGTLEPEKNYKGCDEDCESYKIGGYGSQPEAHAAFAAMIYLLDEQVGEIVAKLETLGLADNTLIIFTSDNGPHQEGGADPDYFNSNGMFRGYKRDLYEGGIRVPMIASWPIKIEKGSTSNHVSAFWDVLPTFAEITNAEISEYIDGISFLPTLLNKPQPKHEFLYWEFHGSKSAQATIISGEWKVLRTVKNKEFTPLEVYNLTTDPEEQYNVADQNPELLEKALKIFEEESTPSPIPQFRFGE